MFTTAQRERFWAKVKKTKTCWKWTAGCDGQGNGAFSLEPGKQIAARRFAYEEANEPIPSGMRIGSTCDVKLCVRPDHLRVVPRGRVAVMSRDAHLWAKIDKRGGEFACWPWMGAVQSSDERFPYPLFSWWDSAQRRYFTVRAARLLWEIVHGRELRDGEIIRHVVCRNPVCMNPRHFVVGTHKDNVADAMRDGTASQRNQRWVAPRLLTNKEGRAALARIDEQAKATGRPSGIVAKVKDFDV
jgi:hypothetical protein